MFCFTVVALRLGVLSVLRHGEYLEKAKANIESKTTLKAERGIIYDRNMVPLAVNITSYRIYITPRDIKTDAEAEIIARGLSDILGVDHGALLNGAKNKSTRDRTVKRNAHEREKAAVLDFIVRSSLEKSVHIEADNKRYYPYGSLLANVIGFVGTDGGLIGVEAYYDEYLKGENGVYITQKNASGSSLDNSVDTFIKAKDGDNVILTVDITLQSMLEAQLKETFIDSKARERVTGIVMDPTGGEILAMATYPSFDLNDPYTLNDFYLEKLRSSGLSEESDEYKKLKNNYLYEMWNNKAVSVLYEPGSTFKIITTSVALETKVATVSEGFHCAGALKVDGYGTPIRCHKRTGHGALNFAEALQKSCNPTMIRLAQRIGNTRFMEYFKAFGYTAKTGIDLPGEAMGIFHAMKDFNNVELSVYSFGQTFKTTPLMQLCAVSCVANGGTAVTPFVVSKIVDKNDKTVYCANNKSNKRVISKEVSRTISDILIEGVDGDGGAKNAAVAGYAIAAKTGTSQKRDIKNENLYVGSCVAFSVYEEAAISAIIAVDEPTCQNYYGSTVAAPYVGAFLSGALPYLGVEPSFTEEEEARRSVSVGNYLGISVSEAKKEIAKLGVSVTVVGDGETVLAQSPALAQKILKSEGRIILYTALEDEMTVTVPRLEGLTATEAIKLLTDLSLNVKIDGVADFDRGVGATVIKQSIQAGSVIKAGQTVAITLRYLDKKE